MSIGPLAPCTMIYVGGTSEGGDASPMSAAAIDKTSMTYGIFTTKNSYTNVWCAYPGQMWPFTGIGDWTRLPEPQWEASYGFGPSISTGAANLDAIIKWITVHGTIPAGLPDAGTSCPKKVCLLGWSQGSMVIDQELHNLETDPAAPPVDKLTYLLCADPIRPGGVFHHFFAPGDLFLDYTVIRPPDTRYSGDYVFWQYDGGGDWPDGIGTAGSIFASITSALNPIALLNAITGLVCIHGGLSAAVLPPWGPWPRGGSLSSAELINTTKFSNGGTCNSYMLPTFPTPLCFPLTNTPLAPLKGILDRIGMAIIEPMYNRAGRSWSAVQ